MLLVHEHAEHCNTVYDRDMHEAAQVMGLLQSFHCRSTNW